MLARRELSEAQVRQRLSRRGHEPESIDAAVERLKHERAIDDVRVAEAIARTETTIKRRGRLRVRRQIEHAGIAPPTARRAVDEVFGDIDDQALIEAALAKRLRDRTPHCRRPRIPEAVPLPDRAGIRGGQRDADAHRSSTAAVSEQFFVTCPYCGEEVEIFLEPDVSGSFVQDCEVCCNPWTVRVSGRARIGWLDVGRADGSE